MLPARGCPAIEVQGIRGATESPQSGIYLPNSSYIAAMLGFTATIPQSCHIAQSFDSILHVHRQI